MSIIRSFVKTKERLQQEQTVIQIVKKHQQKAMNKNFLQAPCWFRLNSLLALGHLIMKHLLKV